MILFRLYAKESRLALDLVRLSVMFHADEASMSGSNILSRQGFSKKPENSASPYSALVSFEHASLDQAVPKKGVVRSTKGCLITTP